MYILLSNIPSAVNSVEDCLSGEFKLDNWKDSDKNVNKNWSDTPGFNCSYGIQAADIQIKAGDGTYFEASSCYGISWDQSSWSAWEKWQGDDKGTECKDISHVTVQWYCKCPPQPPTSTPTNTPTSTSTPTPDPTSTPTTTPNNTQTPTQTPIATPTKTVTPTPTHNPTPTNTPVSDPTPTATDTPSSSPESTTTPPAVGGDNPIVTSITKTSTPQVLGASQNFNPIIESIKKSLIGQVLGTSFLANTSAPFSPQEKMPSSNLPTNGSILIPKIGLSQPLYQSARIGQEFLVGDHEVLLAEVDNTTLIYGHNSPKIFGNLYRLKSGDAVIVDMGDYFENYIISSKHFVHQSDADFLKIADQDNIVLMTCSYSKPEYRHIFIATKTR